jgi:hypothetical protein
MTGCCLPNAAHNHPLTIATWGMLAGHSGDSSEGLEDLDTGDTAW